MAKTKLKKTKIKLGSSESGSTTATKVSSKSAKKSASSAGGSSSSRPKKQKVAKPESSGSTTTRKSLYPAREKLNVLTEEANRRYHELQDSGTKSRAVLEAVRSLTKSHKEKYYEPSDELFTSNLASTREINRELARTLAFLNDPTSLAGGEEIYERQLGEGLFGAQYRVDGGPGYNEEFVTKADADMVFDIYHRIIEHGGGWEMVVGYFQMLNPGLIDFGSENIINAIYDMVRNKADIKLSEGIEDVSGEIIKRTNELIDNMKAVYSNLSELQLSGNDYGSILTAKVVQTNKAYLSYIMSQNEKNKKG